MHEQPRATVSLTKGLGEDLLHLPLEVDYQGSELSRQIYEVLVTDETVNKLKVGTGNKIYHMFDLNGFT